MAAWENQEFGIHDKQFPPIECLIGYGSGVFRQHGYSEKQRPMVDVIFVVRDADLEQWHRENIKMNRFHYAPLMRAAGAPVVSMVQRTGPGLYYNPGVEVTMSDSKRIYAKYGVITEQALLHDLNTWSHFYAAGRLQKPCLLRYPSASNELRQQISDALRVNRRAALCAALLMCSWNATPESPIGVLPLLSAIVQLSYTGDVRMGVAEDPAKVSNIVKGQSDALWQIYQHVADDMGLQLQDTNHKDHGATGGPSLDNLAVLVNPARRRELFDELPASFRVRCQQCLGSRGYPWESNRAVEQTLSGIVRRASAQQTLKGVLTAGPLGSVAYSARKMCKRWKIPV